MSEFFVRVFRIGKVGKHPNADTLSVTQGPSGYPVVFKTGEFSSGDLAVHIPVDALVDTSLEPFSWLAKDAKLGADGKYWFRVKAIKLRNVPSYGLLVPLERPETGGHRLVTHDGKTVMVSEGQLVSGYLNVHKYDPAPAYNQDGIIQGDMFTAPEEGLVPHYDIEGMRRFRNEIAPGEAVQVTEKIHGSNGRWAFLNDKLLCGSRTKFRLDSVWNRMADQYHLKYILGDCKENNGLVLYGEVYGPGIQDMTYGVGEPKVAFFDVYDSTTGQWFDVEAFELFCRFWGLPTCPVLYEGPYDADKVAAMAEGSTILGKGQHVREGIVVKPMKERWSQEIGRVFLKQPGEGYLLRKGPNDGGIQRASFGAAHADFADQPIPYKLNPAAEEFLMAGASSPVGFWGTVKALFLGHP